MTKERSEDMLTSRQVAALCGVSTTTVYRWIREGYFPGAQQGLGKSSPFRIPREEVKEFVRARLRERGIEMEDFTESVAARLRETGIEMENFLGQT